MAHMNNILDRLDAIELRYEEGWDFVTCGNDETDGFDSRLDAERHVENLQKIADNLDSLAYWEKMGRLAMVDSYGTKVHASDIKMDIEGHLWFDGETDYVTFVALSSHEAIKDFITATDCFFDYCFNADEILPIESCVKDKISPFTCEMVLQYNDDHGVLDPVDSEFLFEAIRKEAGVKSGYED